ncbi:MAG: Bcr/CflA family drug resistance efflux transporter [Alphaproteobacteria bacterium 40-19]|nr:MAG: Bcr/CflA family drug resistance efflux transporter [Alphaproteobacteria bacterium 40-19]
MPSVLLPAIWLIVLIVGLPMLSETVYSPSLPAIAHALQSSETLVEHTLSIYLFGFALGTLFWGKISDIFGRKPCVVLGLVIFSLGCLGCYFSKSIEVLMISRLIQAFGGSIGSVLGQAICRDAFHGPELGRVYSAIGASLALFPALGPVCGGVIATHLGWVNIFLFLILFALGVLSLVVSQLPETHPKADRHSVSLSQLTARLISDKNVLGYGLIIAGCNGIAFSYFAEGSFCLINVLGVSAQRYGLSFMLIAAASMMGGLLSRYLQSSCSSKKIMSCGLWVAGGATGCFSLITLFHSALGLPSFIMISVILCSQIICSFGMSMIISNALALSLMDYQYAIGAASSLFGFFYYCLISVFTFLMGVLHNGSLLPMPLYFLALSCFMVVVRYTLLKDREA